MWVIRQNSHGPMFVTRARGGRGLIDAPRGAAMPKARTKLTDGDYG
jgi:hypothetical protein